MIFDGLPPLVRERFGIRWTRGDERRHRFVRATTRTSWQYVPASLKWYPAARPGSEIAGTG